MVCLSNEGTIQATVRDTRDNNIRRQCIVQLSPTKLVDNVFTEVSDQFHCEADTFELVLQNQAGNTTVLNEHRNKTFGEIKDLNLSGRIVIILGTLKKKNISLTVNEGTDDDLLLGASASPGGDVPPSSADTTMNLMSVELYCPRNQVSKIESCNYVGLVNQAMTCYLNSLLQALFMTPEFRNALYNWEFDGQNPEKSIPFQLQKLFLNLQTSKKSAVETTDLTHSFGWDMQEAWEQHDIQELCRVMFDALEQRFKDTKQANLINDLYEGKMIDYVKCLECHTEKSREDTFLDIPLPVRPFGSIVAYNSVEEALRAFVQPETLDGNNQYFCEKCAKKCDAHKGLKFVKFPYLLTLHLKRFDFDYSTMHRIKLNDKVVFPEILNLNSFVPAQKKLPVEDMSEERENTASKCDDCSTTDSGSALDDESCQGTDISSTVNGQDETCPDDDEGIDMSSGNHHENDKNRAHEPKGPYTYELFSIMIHSGSASGGHYYAYIKDFRKEQWFCFNDQSVNRITEDDIQKTYGGGPQRGYYSGAYTSSTNAYMLMYRQKNKNRNCNAITVEEFPPHIQNLLKQMREKEESDRLAKEKENDMFKLKVYCNLPITNHLKDVKVFPFYDNTLAETASEIYEKLDLKGTVSLEDCRLVTYNKIQDCIECSFDRDDYKFCDTPVKDYIHHSDWYLEIKKPGLPFEVYKSGGVKMKVYIVNIENEEVQGPLNMRINPGETVREVKARLIMFLPAFSTEIENLKLVLEVYNESTHLDEDDVPIKFDSNCTNYKLYVSSVIETDENDKHYIFSKMHKVIDRFVHIVNIDIILPDNDIGTLESLSIPPLDLNQNIDRIEMGSGDRVVNSPSLRVSPQPNNIVIEGFGDQSNSEDSSLSDSDRTLIGDAPGDCIGILSSSSNSPADQHMASPSDPAEDSYNDEVFGNPPEEMNWDDETSHFQNYYFKVICVTKQNKDSIADQDCTRFCRIMVDKRMTIGNLKKHLETVVGVSTQYFKIYQYPNQDVELTDMNKDLNTMKDSDKLFVKLGRVLKKNEMSGRIFQLKPDSTEPFTYLFDYIIAKGQTVASAKKDILLQAKKQHMIDIPYSKCRLRKKNWKNPAKIYLDCQKFSDDIQITNKFEMILQDLGEEERLTKPTQMAVFVKRWCPETLTLTPFHEIVLDNPCMDELKKKLSEESGIPENYLDMAFIKSPFPCDMNILDVQNDLDWISTINQFDTYLLQGRDDGSVFFYRDSRESMKELTPEEKKEINQRENARLGRHSTKTFSPNRRERGLKIYSENLPKKTDDSVAD